jgi:hypothetical protein
MIMSNSISSKKIVGMIFAFIMLSLTIVGCGPSKKELAAQKAAEQRILQIKTQLRENAKSREASSERIPPRVEDPGYEVRECNVPKLPQEVGFISTSGCGSSVCGNTSAGNEIVAWRKWYCEGINLTTAQYRSCVLARWKDGEPTFGSIWSYSCHSAIAFEGNPTPLVVETYPYKLE